MVVLFKLEIPKEVTKKLEETLEKLNKTLDLTIKNLALMRAILVLTVISNLFLAIREIVKLIVLS